MKKSRTFRKSFVAAIAALCLAAPLAVMPMTVSAEDSTTSTYSITITATDSAAIHNYVAYQIFSGDYDGKVLSNINWGSGVNTEEVNGKTLVEAIKGVDTGFENLTDTSASVIAKKLSDYTNDGSVVKEFAEVIGDYLTTPSGMSSATGVTGLSAGYYLVQDNGNVTGEGAKTRYILQVAGTDVKVEAKSSYPTIVKKVQENTNVVDYATGYEDYNDIADYDIGDNIPIVDIGTLPSTLDDYEKYFYEIVDTSDKTLEPQVKYDEVTGVVEKGYVTVEIDGVDVTEQATIKAEKDSNGNTIITVTFEDIKSVELEGNKEVSENSKVTVEYNAKLTEDAVTGREGQESEVYLNFSNDPNENYNPDTLDDTEDRPDGIGQTLPDQVIVFTYQIDITKYLDEVKEGNEAGSTALQEAGFKLLKTIPATDSSDGDTVMVAEFNGDKFSGWVPAVYEDGKIANGTEIVTTNNGVVQFIGIDEGEYTIIETKTPAGYNTMEAKDITIVADTNDSDVTDVDEDDARQNWETDAEAALIDLSCEGSYSISEDDGTVQFNIVNKAGSSLPSTGGIGTTIFYLGGGTMAAVAGVYLITKKRMKNEEDDEI